MSTARAEQVVVALPPDHDRWSRLWNRRSIHRRSSAMHGKTENRDEQRTNDSLCSFPRLLGFRHELDGSDRDREQRPSSLENS